MSGAVLTAASSAKPNSMRQLCPRRRIAPTVSCKLGPRNRRLAVLDPAVWPSSCARSDHAAPEARVAAKRANREVRCAAPANISSPKGCADPKLRRQLPLRPAPGAVRPNGAIPGTVTGEFRRRNPSAPPILPIDESVRWASSIGYKPSSPEISPRLVCGWVRSMLLAPGIGVDELIAGVKRPVARVEAEPTMPMIDGRVQESRRCH